MPWHGRADGMLSESNSAGKLLMHLLDLIRLRLLPPAHILTYFDICQFAVTEINMADMPRPEPLPRPVVS